MRKAYNDHFYLPDILAEWPYQRCINPFYEEVKAESATWVESFNAFDEDAQRKFNRCNFSLCAALIYPNFDKERLRTCADILNLFFIFDEYSDVEDEHGVSCQREAIMDALRNPYMPRLSGECILGEITRQMWVRALPTTPPHAQRRFIDTFETYTAAVVQEAEDRRIGRVRGIESYLNVRRGTVGVLPLCTLVELNMKTDDELLETALGSPIITELDNIVVDMCILGNDMVSYIMERDMGHRLHNVVTAAMHSLQTEVPGALRWVEEEHGRLVERFLATRARVGPVDAEIERYIWGIANVVRATDCWYYESKRYFGERGLQVQRDRWTDAGSTHQYRLVGDYVKLEDCKATTPP